MKLDRSKLKRYSVTERLSKVSTADFARECHPNPGFQIFLDALPNQLQAVQLRKLIEAMVNAIQRQKPILFLYGAHVVKVGLSPLLCQALREGWITYAATNGAGTIHDFELARFGRTSEDVGTSLENGSFGMALETGQEWNQALTVGNQAGLGLGMAVGNYLNNHPDAIPEWSITATASQLGRPITSHVAIGTDITHMHPEADGAVIGAVSYRDFELFCERVADLDDGGVVINAGSAVLMPEVFLKALSIARNLCPSVRNFTTANLDMIRHYRPGVNILHRPTQTSGQAIEIIGPHEIMLPLLFQAVCNAVDQVKRNL
jgi:hypothetical protein